eukprot:TRINITY_DN19360_c0_g1_i1.p1 TRINITY_DN19360_c0_g1~~TRINITY_DN19360_c0_g1_i1.p1  ORF type:complete len:578 (+),score=147.64 TRINITY_DN19360_c0_g1_i1:37-1770(+)
MRRDFAHLQKRQRWFYDILPLILLGLIQGYLLLGLVDHNSSPHQKRFLLEETNTTSDTETTENISQIEEEHEIAETERSLYLLLLTGLEFFAFAAAYFLKKTHFRYLQEAGATILFGCILGAITKLINWAAPELHLQKDIRTLMEPDPMVFFLFLLPPIIFESGYSLKRKNFFQNLGAIIAYAFVGTAIATVITGLLLWLVSLTNGMVSLSFPECLIFGALISAVDPVTVLAIFKELKVDLDLYSNVFGESVMNDAVAIVLYRTVKPFLDPSNHVTFGSIMIAVGQFCLIFAGSCIVGTIVALLSALWFKHTKFYNYPYLETAVLLLFAYASYLIPEGMSLSGIVSVLFCGMIMAHYTYPNLSDRSKDLSTNVASILALMTETIVFVYLGLSLFIIQAQFDPLFIVASIIIILLARAANIYPLTFLVNLSRPPNRRITYKYQFFMWFAGLRGAIAFYLALDIPTENKAVIETTTILIVFFTVLIEGGMTVTLLEKLGIPTGVEFAPTIEEEAYGKANVKVQSAFHGIDSKYLKRWFIRENARKKVNTEPVLDNVEMSALNPHDEEEARTVALDEDPE